MKYESYAKNSVQELQKIFTTSLKHGLTDEEVVKRRSIFGLHQIKQSAITWISVLIRQCKSPMIYLLIGAALISVLLRDFSNAFIILIIVVVNTLLGFFQEYKAEKTVRLLSAYLVTKARVIRSGKEIIIDNKDLVPGDIVLLNPGDAIPADIRLIETEGCTIDEAALTGESLPQLKSTAHPNNIAFMGTSISTGSATGIVIATGANTAFGQVSMLTLTTPHESSFHNNIMKLATFLVKMALIMLVIVIALNLIIKGLNVDIIELVGFSVALALSVTPEALPAVTTSALTQSAYKLAQKKVIIKRLTSIEDLGSITLLCTDKTGTLTENVMTVTDIIKPADMDPLFFAALASHNSRDAFEAAAYGKLSPEDQKKADDIKIIHEDPFDPARRITIKQILFKDQTLAIVKGSLDAVFANCHCLDQATKETYQLWERDHGRRGQRALAVAYAKTNGHHDLPHELVLIGLLAFEDPIKSTVFDTIKKAKHLGITIKILSGDGPEVTGAVAHRVGLIPSADQVITGAQLEALSETEYCKAIDTYTVFARVAPEQKFSILQHLKTHDTIGYLGDGINDAPALKAAHIGIVVSKAAEIARSAADIVLVKKNLGVIIEGIYLGRKTFANTSTYLKTTLCSNIGNFYSIAIASLFIGFLPMLPIQILLVSLLSDAPMIAISTDNVEPEDLQRPPHYNIREIAMVGVFFAIVSCFFDITLFALLRHQPALLQTMWFMMTLCEQIGFIYIIRTKKSIFTSTKPSGILLSLSALALIIGIMLPYTSTGQTFFKFTHPTSHYVWVIIGIMSLYFVVTELVKIVFYRSRNHAKTLKK